MTDDEKNNSDSQARASESHSPRGRKSPLVDDQKPDQYLNIRERGLGEGCWCVKRMMNLFRSSSREVAVDLQPEESSCEPLQDLKAKNSAISDADEDYANQRRAEPIQEYDKIETNIIECEHDVVCDNPLRSSLNSVADHYVHDLNAGDHIVRWTMLGYCYPVQVHGIVLSVGPERVTIVDCGLTAVKTDKAGFSEEKLSSSWTKSRKRMNVLTLIEEKEIKKWKKVHYGEEYTLRMLSKSSNGEPQFDDVSTDEGLYPDLEYERESTAPTDETQRDEKSFNGSEQSISTLTPQKSSSFWPFCRSKSGNSNLLEETKLDVLKESKNKLSQKQLTDQSPTDEQPPAEKSASTFRLPKSDPPVLVLARLRFLLEHTEAEDTCNNDTKNMLPPHHIFYANSECIAVWVKTGHWSTLQAAVFLHSSTIGNVKQTATLAMYLSTQTVTIPAAGIWGFFGGTTTISLVTAQPWIVPALVGGGVVYAGLPTMVLWRAKSQWLETEKRLNVAFWEIVDSSVIVALIQRWSGLEY
jgi:hypothetical protein